MSSENFLRVETPAPIFKTYIGNLLYSTLDLTSELKAIAPVILGQVDIENIFARDFADLSIGEIQNRHAPGSADVQVGEMSPFIQILSPRQKSNLGSNPSGLSIDTAGGRKIVTVDQYSKRVSIDAFEAFIALADEIPLFSGNKASTKASTRSHLWLKQLKASTHLNLSEKYLFGVTCAFTYDQHTTAPSPSNSIVGEESDPRLIADAKELLTEGCDGLVVGGAGMGETLHQLSVAVRSVKQAVEEVSTTNSTILSVPDSKVNKKILIMVQEMDTVREILLAVQSGGDLIGTNFPQLLSTSGLALTWNLKQKNSSGSHIGKCTDSSSSSSSSSRSGSIDVEKRKSSSQISSNEDTEHENPNKKQNVDMHSIPLIPVHENPAGQDSTIVTDHAYARTGTTTTIITTIITAHRAVEENASEADKNVGMNINGDENVDGSKNKHETPSDYKHAQSKGGVINLWESIHRKELKPICDSCECHACRNHTRAYIHHLLHAKEMLGDILVYCHNQYQTVLLFNEIRCIQKEGASSFKNWSTNLINVMHEN